MSAQMNTMVIEARIDIAPLPRRTPGAALLASLDDMRARDAVRVLRHLGLPLTVVDAETPAAVMHQSTWN